MRNHMRIYIIVGIGSLFLLGSVFGVGIGWMAGKSTKSSGGLTAASPVQVEPVLSPLGKWDRCDHPGVTWEFKSDGTAEIRGFGQQAFFAWRMENGFLFYNKTGEEIILSVRILDDFLTLTTVDDSPFASKSQTLFRRIR